MDTIYETTTPTSTNNNDIVVYSNGTDIIFPMSYIRFTIFWRRGRVGYSCPDKNFMIRLPPITNMLL